MLSKQFREKIRSGVPVSGCTISSYSPENIEILGILGYDFAFVDSEHWPLSDREILSLITAGDAVGMPCLIRVKENSPAAIQRVMESGAAGVVVPDVATAELAKQVVDAVKYRPIGDRGLSTTRASCYGLEGGLADYVKKANEESVIVCQIESVEGVRNAKEIIANENIDAVFIGTTDLSNSMGLTGKRNDPVVKQAVESVIELAKIAGRSYGAMVRADEDPVEYKKQGYCLMVASGIGFFTGGAKKYINAFKTME